MSVLPLVITLLACADTVEQELFDAELDNRDLQLNALFARMDALEATVSAQADVITAQDAALAALGQSLSAEDDVLAARIDAVEARDDAQDEALDGLDGEVAVIGAAVEGLASDAEGVAGELAALDTRVSEVEASVAGIPRGVDLSAIEADVTDLDTRVTSMESNGRVWTSGGLGTSGTCALVTVDVTEPTTLIVAGTASADLDLTWEAMLSDYYDPARSAYVSGPSAPFAQLTATVIATSASGTWSDEVETTAGAQNASYDGGDSPWYAMPSGVASAKVQANVFSAVTLPSAGTYTVRVELASSTSGSRSFSYPGMGSYPVTATSLGAVTVTDCNLVVIDP